GSNRGGSRSPQSHHTWPTRKMFSTSHSLVSFDAQGSRSVTRLSTAIAPMLLCPIVPRHRQHDLQACLSPTLTPLLRTATSKSGTLEQRSNLSLAGRGEETSRMPRTARGPNRGPV